MKKLLLLTGNQHKVNEWKRLLPSDIELETIEIDLPEIQSLDLKEIVEDKARKAYEITGKPVVVEDISAGLVKLNGLPGPFIKYFIESLGQDALYQLAGKKGEHGTASCAIARYDGTTMMVVQGDIDFTVVAPRGESGFGFEKVIVPVGHTKTYSQMSPEEKDSISHRAKALRLLLKELRL